MAASGEPSLERGWDVQRSEPPSRSHSVLDVDRALKFRAQSRASSRLSERQPRHTPAPLTFSSAAYTGGNTAELQANNAGAGPLLRNRTSHDDAQSDTGGSRRSEQYEECSSAGGTASTDTGIGSEVSYARRYLQNQLTAGTPHEMAFAQRVAKDAKSAVAVRKFVTTSVGAAMEGLGVLFRGQRGQDTRAGWAQVIDDPSNKGARKKRPTHTMDASGYTHLAYIERGKTAALAQIGEEQVRQEQVLATARCFGTLIEQLEALSRGGAAHRRRIVALGGAQVLASACRFIRDEELLLKCVTCIFRLAHDFELRRQLLQEQVHAAEALAGVVCRPHISEVVSVTLDTLGLLCLDGDVASSLPNLGVLNAIYSLCLKAPPDEIPVLHSATTLLSTLSKDRTCLRAMNAKGTRLMSSMFRLLRVCRDSTVSSLAAGALAAICEGHNRIVMGRHKSIGALLLVVERAALETEQCAANGSSPRGGSPRRGENELDFVAGTCALISRLSEVKEHRERLVRAGVIPPLVALVLMSDAGSESAMAAKAAIKTVEVEEDFRQQVEKLVDEYVEQMSAAAPSTAGSRSQASSRGPAKSVASSTRTGGSTKREHWTDRLAGIGLRRGGEEEAPARGGTQRQQPDRDLLLKYLADQSVQRERDLALIDQGVAAGASAVHGDLDALNEEEEEEGAHGLEPSGHADPAEEGGCDDMAFFEGHFVSDGNTRQATAATRRATAATGVTIATAATAATAGKADATIEGQSRVATGWREPGTPSPGGLSDERPAANASRKLPGMSNACAREREGEDAAASPAPSGKSDAAKTPLSNRSTSSLQDDAQELRARLDRLKQDLSKATAMTEAGAAAPAAAPSERGPAPVGS